MSVFGSMSLILRKLIVSAILMIVCKALLDLYFKTKNGFLLRAVGDNSVLVTSLSKDKGIIKIIGLVISNALVALSGAVACQEQRSFSATMGTGQIVFGLAAVIIGTTLFRRVSFIKGTTAVIFGSVIYKACIQIAISLGFSDSLRCAPQIRPPVQRATASPSTRSTSEPHTGQCVGNTTSRVSSGRSESTTLTTCGITSPARRITTLSPMRKPRRSISSALCKVALLTSTPATWTGSRRATGVIAPVRPT